jgi:hypothetical protein
MRAGHRRGGRDAKETIMGDAKTHQVKAAKKAPKTDDKLLLFSQTIVTKGTNNSNFTSPGTVFTDLAAANTAYGTAIQNMKTQKGASGAKTSARTTVLQRVDAVIAFVNSIAQQFPPDQARAIIQSAGLQVRQVPAHNKQQLAAKYGGISGAVILIALAAAKQAGYVFAYSMDQKTWVPCLQVFKAKMVISGLTVGTTYYFRFQAQTRKGLQDWSMVVSFVVR